MQRQAFNRKPTGGLQRQSLVSNQSLGNRDSVGSVVTAGPGEFVASPTTVDEQGMRGVELTDRPMDD